MKKILSVILCMCLIIMVLPLGMLELDVSAATYPTDYKKWSQGASSYEKMNGYGCWVVAQAKLIYECNIDREASFNPDTYMIWEQNNGYLNSNFNQVNGVNAPVAYAKYKGKTLNYLGCTSSSVETKIWDNISKGYKSIVYVTTSSGYAHYIMIANDLSTANGKLYCYDSWSGYAAVSPQNVASRNYRSINEVYSYSTDASSGSENTHTHNYTIHEYEAAHPHKYYKKCSCGDFYYTGENANVSTCSSCTSTVKEVTIENNTSKNTISDNNAVLWARVDKPSSDSVTKIGIRVRKEGDTYENGWEKFEAPSQSYEGEEFMEPYYNMNTELNLTLTHATKYYYKIYAKVEGKEYWSPETSFTTTGSHSYGSWTTTTAATCTAAGVQTRTCSCGKAETKAINALGHEYESEFTVDKESTCAAAGSKSRHCIRCSAKTEVTEIAKADHTYLFSYDEECNVCGYIRVVTHRYSYYDWTFDYEKAMKLLSDFTIEDEGSMAEVMEAYNQGFIESKEFLSTDMPIPPEAPERKGYKFTGWKIIAKPGESMYDITSAIYYVQAQYEKLPYVTGDLSGDGNINNRDLALLMQYINGWPVEVVEDAADVNADNTVNNRDYALLMQYVNGWPVELK